MTSKQLRALEDLALHFAEEPPKWTLEYASVQIRLPYRHYYLIDEVDAGRLEALRKMIPSIIEERRKLVSHE